MAPSGVGCETADKTGEERGMKSGTMQAARRKSQPPALRRRQVARHARAPSAWDRDA
jgi:hypothetical protein